MTKHINSLIAGISYLILAVTLGVVGWYVFHPIQLVTNDLVIDLEKDYDPLDNIQSLIFGNKSDVKVSGNLNEKEIGNYTLTYQLGNFTTTANATVKDVSAPVVETQDLTVDLIGDVHPEDFVKKAWDAQDITYEFVKGCEKEEGHYPIVIKASDPSGNSKEYKANLYRMPDTTAPYIDELEKPIFLQAGQTIDVDSFTIHDDFDPTPTVNLDFTKVNFCYPGVYTLNAHVEDRSGNYKDYETKVIISQNTACSIANVESQMKTDD